MLLRNVPVTSLNRLHTLNMCCGSVYMHRCNTRGTLIVENSDRSQTVQQASMARGEWYATAMDHSRNLQDA
jgi:hypothetical protein